MAGKFILIVLDSVGIGELPDAAKFGDKGSHTLGNIEQAIGGLDIPNLRSLGLSKITNARLQDDGAPAEGCYGRMAERFVGKDTTGGHWEIAGVIPQRPFPTYPDGFPPHIIAQLEEAIGRKTLCNRPASGTEIIAQLGDEHVRTGYPIVYTSADSVFQIAMHENVIPLEEQYAICKKAREILAGEHAVGRVIARPFSGESGNYTRTENRRDYSLEPPQQTILDALKEAGLEVAGIGKIEDIFAHRGLTRSDHTTNNRDGIEAIVSLTKEKFDGLIFANLVDFDSLYGHRNDARGYARALEEFDRELPRIIEQMEEEDILVITADHGCDPTTPSTDHSREYVPILVYGEECQQDIDLGTRKSFADIAATIADYFCLDPWPIGKSFLYQIL